MHDEGAANHMRLAPAQAAKGLHVFIYGQGDGARQTLPASQALAAQHRIPDAQALFLRQNPEAIRRGVFHNDVIAVSNDHVLLLHEEAYAEGWADIERMADAYGALHGKPPVIIAVGAEQLSIEEAVYTYFFNSQIITKPDGKMALIAPIEAQLLYEGKGAQLMERICMDGGNPIDEVHYVDLRQSMRNGGGPACLRLRVPMTRAQLAAMQKDTHVVADEALLSQLARLIEKYYPDELLPEGLGDPKLYHECERLLSELGELMRLPLLSS